MNKYSWLAITLLGTAISLYGNKKVQECVREETANQQISEIITRIVKSQQSA